MKPAYERDFGRLALHRQEELLSQLGKQSDGALARQFKLKPRVVLQIRRARGIPAIPRPGLTKADREAIILRLGVEFDLAIAREYGVAPSTIGKLRQSLGIEPIDHRTACAGRALPCNAKVTGPEREELLSLLGKIPDLAIARKFGLITKAVQKLRVARGIARAPRTSSAHLKLPPQGEREERLQRAVHAPKSAEKAANEHRVGAHTVREVRRAAGIYISEREDWLVQAVVVRLSRGPASAKTLIAAIESAAPRAAKPRTRHSQLALLVRRGQIQRLRRGLYALPAAKPVEG